MEKWRVLITDKIPQRAIDHLKKDCDVVVNETEKAFSEDTLKVELAKFDATLCMLSDSINRQVIEAAPELKVVANYAVGFNNIDIQAASERRIFVTNTPDVLTETTADLTWALMFSTARRVVSSDAFLRAGKFDGWHPQLFLGQDITGKTLGIIGGGRIGRATARKATGFDMKVLYYSRRQKPELEEETGACMVGLDTLLKECDFVSLHLPLKPETRHLIGERELKLMKSSAILINTARGPIVDEKALVKALKEGWIWGAGLDVFENEPIVEPELMHLDNAVLLPHIGSGTVETRDKMAFMAANSILTVKNGKIPKNWVNRW